ncbi:kinase-like domain-containing protein [Chytriomyces cf. hyalinus JEL632]|nr:kinase-like domain-containing protein [Chytriomyces cf. hyalinus JEL632]
MLGALDSPYGYSTPALSRAGSVTPNSMDQTVPLWAKYTVTGKCGEGAYGSVLRAQCRFTGKVVAIKKMLTHADESITSSTIREIMISKTLTEAAKRKDFPFIVRQLELFNDEEASFMVMEYFTLDLCGFMHEHRNAMPYKTTKHIMLQLMLAIIFIQERGYIHRDLKPSNIMVASSPSGVQIKLIDFGLGRETPIVHKPYSPQVQTIIYRAPEVLLQKAASVGALKVYDNAIDVWSAGCIFAELVGGSPLFYSPTEIGVRSLVIQTLGKPAQDDFQGFEPESDAIKMAGNQNPKMSLDARFPAFSEQDPDGMHLMKQMFLYSPKKRIWAYDSISHPYFKELHSEYTKYIQDYI